MKSACQGCVVLFGLTLLAASQVEHALVAAFVLPLLGGLLAIELDRGSGRISLALTRAAARALPRRDRDNFRDEWIDHVLSAGEQGVAPLSRAISITLIAAPLLAIGLRIGRRARRPA
jgi:hypothetical protein